MGLSDADHYRRQCREYEKALEKANGAIDRERAARVESERQRDDARADVAKITGAPDYESACDLAKLLDNERERADAAFAAGVRAGIEAGGKWYDFGRAVWLWLADNWESEDGWDLAQMAVTAGLAERVKYDPDKHGECDADIGDEITEITWPIGGDPPALDAETIVARIRAIDPASVKEGT